MCAFKAARASVNRPDTWGDFDEACAAVESGAYEYAGFVFAGDGLVGIDIDHAFGDDGLLLPEAVEAVRACASYTEVSKSGSGLHIVCEGELPFDGCNNRQGWEIYRDKRYFVMTGSVVMYGDVSPAQEGIDLVLERHFSERDMEGRGGDANNRSTIWKMGWDAPKNGRVPIFPRMDTVASGSRHLSLVSFCGQLHSMGFSYHAMLALASAANETYLLPPLPDAEVAQVAKSVSRYRR